MEAFAISGAASKQRRPDGTFVHTSHVLFSGRPPKLAVPVTDDDMGRFKAYVVNKHLLYQRARELGPEGMQDHPDVLPPTAMEQRTPVCRAHFDCDVFVREGERFSRQQYTQFLMRMTACIQQAAKDCYTQDGVLDSLPPGMAYSAWEPGFAAILATTKVKVVEPEAALPTMLDSEARKLLEAEEVETGESLDEAEFARRVRRMRDGRPVFYDQEWKAHIYFPGLFMTSHQLRVLRLVAVRRLDEGFAGTDFPPINWAAALDDRVYTLNGLRMLFCDKIRRCACRPVLVSAVEARAAAADLSAPTAGRGACKSKYGPPDRDCAACFGSGQVPAGRVYRVVVVLGRDGSFNQAATSRLTKNTKESMLAALDATQIRLGKLEVTPGFRRPHGIPAITPFVYSAKPRVMEETSCGLLYAPRKGTYLERVEDARDWRVAYLLHAVRGYASSAVLRDPVFPYARLKDAFVYISKRATNPYIIVDVVGPNDSYCLNRKRCHNRCGRAYFMVVAKRARGKQQASPPALAILQKCSCQKDVPGVLAGGLTCKQYSERSFLSEADTVVKHDLARMMPPLPDGHTVEELFARPSLAVSAAAGAGNSRKRAATGDLAVTDVTEEEMEEMLGLFGGAAAKRRVKWEDGESADGGCAGRGCFHADRSNASTDGHTLPSTAGSVTSAASAEASRRLSELDVASMMREAEGKKGGVLAVFSRIKSHVVAPKEK